MADRIAKLITPGRPIFVIVGAAHLVTDTSIPKQLTARGFTVKQVDKKPVPPTPAVESSAAAKAKPAVESTAAAAK